MRKFHSTDCIPLSRKDCIISIILQWSYKVILFVFQGHQDEVFVLEAHPTDPHILLSAGEVHRVCR